jgi:hypothetical protein
VQNGKVAIPSYQIFSRVTWQAKGALARLHVIFTYATAFIYVI